MMPGAQLQTARLTLRQVTAEDEAVVVACLNELDVTGWLAVVPYPYTSADFREFVTEIARPGQTFAVEDGEGLAGIVAVQRELGYWFAPRAHGKGYATEAARAVLAMRLAKDATPVGSGYFEGNRRSANVLRKLGFAETGRGLKYCRALRQDRPHVDMLITLENFTSTLPIEARSVRLTFRSMQATDHTALHRIVSQWEVLHQLGAKWNWPPDEAFTASRARPYRGQGFVWGVFLDGGLIGTVGVTDGELGYMLDPAHWGRGLAAEACRTAIAHAFAAGLDHLTAGVWADNAASLKLLGRLGFVVTGHDVTFSRARQADTPGHLLRLDRADWSPR